MNQFFHHIQNDHVNGTITSIGMVIMTFVIKTMAFIFSFMLSVHIPGIIMDSVMLLAYASTTLVSLVTFWGWLKDKKRKKKK